MNIPTLKSSLLRKELIIPLVLTLLVGVGVYTAWPRGGPVSIQKNQATSVTHLYVFSSVADPTFQGEGFFVTLKDGREVLVYSRFEDSPHDVVNMERKMSATTKEVGSFNFTNERREDVYLGNKSELGAGNALLSPENYQGLAARIREIGNHKVVTMVYYKDIQFLGGEVRIMGSNITSVGNISMTTGGSVYTFLVNVIEGKPLNIWVDTQRADGQQLLGQLADRIRGIIGTPKTLVAKDVDYQEEIYAMSGTRSGWTTPFQNISIEE